MPLLGGLTAFLPMGVRCSEKASSPLTNERTGYLALKEKDLPRDEQGFLLPDVWEIVKKEAEAKPSSNEAMILKERPIYQAYYKTYAGWTPPPPIPVGGGRLRNLSDPPNEPRFPLTDKVWPEKVGEASVCLWEDDKLAAMSLGVDDNFAMDLPYWRELSAKYGKLNIVWNLITCNIDGGVSKGRLSAAGTWAIWQQMIDEGYHLVSHSMTHNHDPVPADGWPGPDWEAAESKRLLDSHLKGQNTKVFVYPGSGVHVFNIYGGYSPKSNWRPALVKYYAAARGGGGDALNQANLIDYFNIHATTGNVLHLLDEADPKYAAQDLNNLFAADPASPYHKYYRGWANVFIHFINCGQNFDTNPFTVAYGKILDFYNKNRDNLWTGYFDDVALYGQERDTATLTTDVAGAAAIRFTLTSKMDPAIFNYPLTVKVRLPDSWKNATASQNSTALPVQVISHEGANFALVKVVPDRGQVTLTPTAD